MSPDKQGPQPQADRFVGFEDELKLNADPNKPAGFKMPAKFEKQAERKKDKA